MSFLKTSESAIIESMLQNTVELSQEEFKEKYPVFKGKEWEKISEGKDVYCGEFMEFTDLMLLGEEKIEERNKMDEITDNWDMLTENLIQEDEWSEEEFKEKIKEFEEFTRVHDVNVKMTDFCYAYSEEPNQSQLRVITPLILACGYSKIPIQVIEILLNNGANISITDKEGL